MLKNIKVLIIDDSAFMRKLITDFLSEDSRIEVIGTARNGEEGLKKIEQYKPDVVTLDIEMPVMNGLDCLKQIMQRFLVPVIMLSSTTKVNADNTILAMRYGAFDFIAKPSGPISLDLVKIKQELIEKIKAANAANIKELASTSINIKKSVKKQIEYSNIELESKQRIIMQKDHIPSIICIGTSTGGPMALQKVVEKLPKEINAIILIVQHMPAKFTKSLANRLNQLSEISVKEAEDGEKLKKGVAYIAPGGYHLSVEHKNHGLTALITETPPVNGHRPSVDVLFESISQVIGYSKVAVIMTGMGSDGAKGVQLLKIDASVKVIAESEETAIVYGMPKAAISTKLVDEVKPINKIAETILKYV